MFLRGKKNITALLYCSFLFQYFWCIEKKDYKNKEINMSKDQAFSCNDTISKTFDQKLKEDEKPINISEKRVFSYSFKYLESLFAKIYEIYITEFKKNIKIITKLSKWIDKLKDELIANADFGRKEEHELIANVEFELDNEPYKIQKEDAEEYREFVQYFNAKIDEMSNERREMEKILDSMDNNFVKAINNKNFKGKDTDKKSNEPKNLYDLLKNIEEKNENLTEELKKEFRCETYNSRDFLDNKKLTKFNHDAVDFNTKLFRWYYKKSPFSKPSGSFQKNITNNGGKKRIEENKTLTEYVIGIDSDYFYPKNSFSQFSNAAAATQESSFRSSATIMQNSSFRSSDTTMPNGSFRSSGKSKKKTKDKIFQNSQMPMEKKIERIETERKKKAKKKIEECKKSLEESGKICQGKFTAHHFTGLAIQWDGSCGFSADEIRIKKSSNIKQDENKSLFYKMIQKKSQSDCNNQEASEENELDVYYFDQIQKNEIEENKEFELFQKKYKNLLDNMGGSTFQMEKEREELTKFFYWVNEDQDKLIYNFLSSRFKNITRLSSIIETLSTKDKDTVLVILRNILEEIKNSWKKIAIPKQDMYFFIVHDQPNSSLFPILKYEN